MRRREFVGLIGGAAALWSLAAKAQGKVPVIGYLHFATPDYQPAAASFLKGLAETGFIEGKDFSVAYRWAEGHYDSLPAMASELDDRFHETGIEETGSMELEGCWWIPRLRLAERGAVSWQDGVERSRWR